MNKTNNTTYRSNNLLRCESQGFGQFLILLIINHCMTISQVCNRPKTVSQRLSINLLYKNKSEECHRAN